MTPCEFAAIEARANSADDSRGAIQRADIYCIEVPSSFFDRISASQRDVRELLAAVRERDNTIARVRALHWKTQWDGDIWVCDHCRQLEWQFSDAADGNVSRQVMWPCPTISALDPQETP